MHMYLHIRVHGILNQVPYASTYDKTYSLSSKRISSGEKKTFILTVYWIKFLHVGVFNLYLHTKRKCLLNLRERHKHFFVPLIFTVIFRQSLSMPFPICVQCSAWLICHPGRNVTMSSSHVHFHVTLSFSRECALLITSNKTRKHIILFVQII